jgi:hypothetical protein
MSDLTLIDASGVPGLTDLVETVGRLEPAWNEPVTP